MPQTINDFRDLIVWQRAMELATVVYSLTREFPADERFGLTLQLKRAAVSVASNIAEGHERRGREFRHFLGIARGSAAEVECQLLLAAAFGFTTEQAIAKPVELCREIRRMAAAIIRKLPA